MGKKEGTKENQTEQPLTDTQPPRCLSHDKPSTPFRAGEILHSSRKGGKVPPLPMQPYPLASLQTHEAGNGPENTKHLQPRKIPQAADASRPRPWACHPPMMKWRPFGEKEARRKPREPREKPKGRPLSAPAVACWRVVRFPALFPSAGILTL